MYHFIINPKSSSGKGIRFWWTVKNELERLNIPYKSYVTRFEGQALKIAHKICTQVTGIKSIVVLGGDGTINEVINGIENFDEVLLGYIPSGSSNDLARSLNIPKDPLLALSNIINPTRYLYLDYGEIDFLNGQTRKFACSSGIGYDANVCREVQLSPWKKKLNKYGAGKFIYLMIAIKQLLTIPFAEGYVVTDGIKKGPYKKILLASGMIQKYEGGGLLMAPHADATDGKLNVCLVHGMSRLKIALLLPSIFFGKHIYFKGVEEFVCSSFEIVTKENMAVHTDGEVIPRHSHIKIRCVPGKIRMIR